MQFVGVCRGRLCKKAHVQEKGRDGNVEFKWCRASREGGKEVVEGSRKGRTTQTKGLSYAARLWIWRGRHPRSSQVSEVFGCEIGSLLPCALSFLNLSRSTSFGEETLDFWTWKMRLGKQGEGARNLRVGGGIS